MLVICIFPSDTAHFSCAFWSSVYFFCEVFVEVFAYFQLGYMTH